MILRKSELYAKWAYEVLLSATLLPLLCWLARPLQLLTTATSSCLPFYYLPHWMLSLLSACSLSHLEFFALLKLFSCNSAGGDVIALSASQRTCCSTWNIFSKVIFIYLLSTYVQKQIVNSCKLHDIKSQPNFHTVYLYFSTDI